MAMLNKPDGICVTINAINHHESPSIASIGHQMPLLATINHH